MPPEFEQPTSRASRRSRAWLVILALLGLGILLAVLVPKVLLFIAFGQAMSSFGPAHREGQMEQGGQLIVFVVIGGLPLVIYFLCRMFSKTRKRRGQE